MQAQVKNKGRNILIICIQGIGNTLLTLYAAEKFVKLNSATLHMIVSNNGSQELAFSELPQNHVYVWDEDRSTAKNIMNLGIKLRQKKFDEVFLAYASYKREGLMGLLANSREKKVLLDGNGDWRFLRKIYKSKIQKPANIHDINANFLLLGLPNQGYLSSYQTLINRVKQDYGNYAASFFSEKGLIHKFVVAVHPGTVGVGKRWPAEKFIKLCREMKKKFDCRFVVIGGNDEILLKQTIVNCIGESAVLLDSCSLLQTASILSRCNLFIGNDSAPMHLSAILGVPVVALWGYTDFYRTSPYGSGHIIIRKTFQCSPCYSSSKRFKNDCEYDLRCIKKLELADVLPIVSQCVKIMLDKNRSVNADDVISMKIDSIDRIYTLEHGCTVVDCKG